MTHLLLKKYIEYISKHSTKLEENQKLQYYFIKIFELLDTSFSKLNEYIKYLCENNFTDIIFSDRYYGFLEDVRLHKRDILTSLPKKWNDLNIQVKIKTEIIKIFGEYLPNINSFNNKQFKFIMECLPNLRIDNSHLDVNRPILNTICSKIFTNNKLYRYYSDNITSKNTFILCHIFNLTRDQLYYSGNFYYVDAFQKYYLYVLKKLFHKDIATFIYSYLNI